MYAMKRKASDPFNNLFLNRKKSMKIEVIEFNFKKIQNKKCIIIKTT